MFVARIEIKSLTVNKNQNILSKTDEIGEKTFLTARGKKFERKN